MKASPLIMAAVNGARLQKSQCPAVPVSVGEIAAAAAQCFFAGAAAAHIHVRGGGGEHVLDAGLYREASAEIKKIAPALTVQITTESVGRYSPAEQRQVVRDVAPAEVSVALAEMISDGDIAGARRFYHWAAEAGVRVQHILRAAKEMDILAGHARDGVLPAADLSLLFVLGAYGGAAARPSDLPPFLSALQKSRLRARFMVCAFGRRESDCLLAAAAGGGDCRVGFENNIYSDKGGLAPDNAARVAELKTRLAEAGF